MLLQTLIALHYRQRFNTNIVERRRDVTCNWRMVLYLNRQISTPTTPSNGKVAIQQVAEIECWPSIIRVLHACRGHLSVCDVVGLTPLVECDVI